MISAHDVLRRSHSHMLLPHDIQEEIRELFSRPGEILSDAEVQEIASNLLSFTLHIGDGAR